MTVISRRLFASSSLGLLLALYGGLSLAAETKDIVLERVRAPAIGAPATSGGDAMAVSVLQEAPDGTLTPRATDRVFRTGDRFRVKVLASRDAHVSLFNTNPSGVLRNEPVWRGEVKVGQELITPRLRLDGQSGTDLLHVVLEPKREAAGVVTWLGSWLRRMKDGSAKDIRLDVQNTDTATYLLNANGQGLVTTVRIVHR